MANGEDPDLIIADAGFSFSGAISALVAHTPQGWKFLAGHTSGERPR